jgi:CHASE3 domain sensor protein
MSGSDEAVDAETGQRGYLLTGEESYLEPYSSAVAALPGEFATLRGLIANRPQQKKRLEALESFADQKMNELRTRADQHPARGTDAAARTSEGCARRIERCSYRQVGGAAARERIQERISR